MNYFYYCFTIIKTNKIPNFWTEIEDFISLSIHFFNDQFDIPYTEFVPTDISIVNAEKHTHKCNRQVFHTNWNKSLVKKKTQTQIILLKYVQCLKVTVCKILHVELNIFLNNIS